MRLASVILDIPARQIDGMFTYAVPDGMEQIQVGCPVRVNFGARPAIGLVAELIDASSERGKQLVAGIGRLKPIVEVVGPRYFDEDGAACALHIAQSCMAPLSQCIRMFTPPGSLPKLVKEAGEWLVMKPAVAPVDKRYVRLTEKVRSFTPRANAVKQKAVLEALSQGELLVSELSREYGAIASTLSSLEKQGVVEIESRRILRGIEPAPAPEKISYGLRVLEGAQLTAGQEGALSAITEKLEKRQFGVVLLDGVTGSGKTEVYLRAIQNVLDKGGNALVLVPEISLTPQTVARFRGRFGDRVAVLHSRMGAGERYDQWEFILSGAARVVVGARSALFAPLANLGIIVIDEEHESSYKQDSTPRYHARSVAEWMAKRRNIPLVLGSATPSIESLYACETDASWTRVEMPERANKKPLPKVAVVDMAQEFRGGSRSMFSRELLRALTEELRAGRKAILFLNQRGFAQFLLCRDCGYVPSCSECATSLTYHEREHALVCHHCLERHPVPPRCPACNSPYLKRFGAGTQRVETELARKLAEEGLASTRIIRMDADTTKAKGAHQRLLDAFMQDGPAVLLGTQMIAKGLDIAEVTLVGVINADTQLNLPDFRSAERTYQLIEQVAGRAGRSKLPGQVVVQTYQATNPAIRAAASHSREIFLEDELPKRKALGYPPFMRLANLLVWGKEQARVVEAAQAIHASLSALAAASHAPLSVLPASPCVLSQLRGSYRWHILMRAPADFEFSEHIGAYFKDLKLPDKVFHAIDVDPSSIF